MKKTSLGCVVMAAGNARRFGANKLAAEVDGKSLIRRTLEAIPAEQFDAVTVVTQYPEVAELAAELGFMGYMQERSSAKEEYTPDFDLIGIDK